MGEVGLDNRITCQCLWAIFASLGLMKLPVNTGDTITAPRCHPVDSLVDFSFVDFSFVEL